MRFEAAAHFELTEVLTVRWQDAEAKLQSEYTGGDKGRDYPVTIHGEIRGPADTFEDAEQRLATMIGNTVPRIAVASNAAVGEPLAVMTHGLDLTAPQPFTAYRTPRAKEWPLRGGRRIDLDATVAFMMAVAQHGGAELPRSVEAYRRALSHWIPEQLLLAGDRGHPGARHPCRAHATEQDAASGRGSQACQQR